MQRELVERAQAGDHDAFAVLARASGDRLYALASLILGDSAAAEDALQEALMLAWRDIGALREPDAWDAWLKRLTVRACYKLARHERKHRHLEWISVHHDSTIGVDNPASILDRDEVERGFRALSPDQRAILVLHYYLGLPLTEAAMVLGIPSGTVKSRLHRALLSMRTTLSARGTTIRPRSGEHSA
jgi:RNA polymerase sigma-70 factor (ECF subfamily)